MAVVFLSNIDLMTDPSLLCLSCIGLISALVVVSAKNPIHRIASLIIVFIIGAFMFMLLDFYFLGLTYIIVYVGAIAILFLFVIMMIPIDHLTYSKTEDTRITSLFHSPMTIQPLSSLNCAMVRGSYFSGVADAQINLLGTAVGHWPLILENSSATCFTNHRTYGPSSKELHSMYLFTGISDVSSAGVPRQSVSESVIFNIYIRRCDLSSLARSGSSALESIYSPIGRSLYLFIPPFIIFLILNSYSDSLIFTSVEQSGIALGDYAVDSFARPTTLLIEGIYTFFYPCWAIEYKNISDIESLGLLIYVAYPTALILISIALWTVMIGIISICSPKI